jgi:small subunit ribosomal protein S2
LAEVTIKQLIEAGAHFGHQKYRWNPKMKRYVFERRNGLYIIDLAKTINQIRVCMDVIREVVKNNKSILFVGTKKQAKTVIRDCAEKCGEYYVSERWLGGLLTNLSTIRQSVKKLENIEKRISSGGEGLTKKEISQLAKEQEKLNRNLSGIRAMRKPPGLVVVVDPSKEHIAVAEANKLGIPVMGLVDTNCDPDPIDHVIACNDDALKSVRLIVSALSQVVIDEKNARSIPMEKENTSSSDENNVSEETKLNKQEISESTP